MCVLILATCALLVWMVDCLERDMSVSNSTYYSTREMRDMVLDEWAGKSEQIQQYFDQLPSKEFRENSEDLKFKLYWERKGIKNIRSNEVFNITTPIRHPQGPEYSIEVNDSYVPKYRVTTSEERRMELYGTFNSESSESSTESDISKIKPTTEPPDSGGKKPSEKRGKKGEKKWPPHMNPKQRRRKRKKAQAYRQSTQGKNKEIFLMQRMVENQLHLRNTPHNHHKSNYGPTQLKTFQIQLTPNNDFMQQKHYKQASSKKQERKSKSTSIFKRFMLREDSKRFQEARIR